MINFNKVTVTHYGMGQSANPRRTQTPLFYKQGQGSGQGHSNQIKVIYTMSSQDASTDLFWDSYLR